MSPLEFNAKPFLEALCKYYMEFIETDFKSNRPPSRRIVFTRDDLVSDIKLDKYPKLNQTAFNLLRNSFRTTHLKNVNPRSFFLPFPPECVKRVRNLSDEISEDEFFNIIDKMFDDFKLYNYEKHFAALQDIYEDEGKQGVIEYLENTPATSFFEDIYELWKNKQILDKQSIYLYFCDLKYEKSTYPIFYIPIQVEASDTGEFILDFDPVLLINKKAIEYVTSKWKEKCGKDWKMDLPNRQVYLSNYESGGSLLEDLQGTINNLCYFLGHVEFKLDQDETVKARVGPFELSNNCYLSLFDNSDEALLNDYEELLQLILNDDDAVAKDLFEKISTDFLFENPTTFESQIETEYGEKSVPSRLAYTSPISLNQEQLQVLNSINKPDCNRIVIEGPPGTGKSHTITAIIYNALLQKKSVLMVSDKKEALDVVEEKINHVLDTMKLDEFVQNPILRLGKKETNYNNIFKPLNYDKIKTRYIGFRKYKEQVNSEIQKLLNDVEKNITSEIENESLYKAATIQSYLNNEKSYEKLWNIFVNSNEYMNVNNYAKLLGQTLINLNEIKSIYKSLYNTFQINLLQYTLCINEFINQFKSLKNDVSLIIRAEKAVDNNLLLKNEMTYEKTVFLENSLDTMESLKKPIIGYLFSGNQIRALETEFSRQFITLSWKPLRQNKVLLFEELRLYKQIQQLNNKWAKQGLDFFGLYSKNLLNGLYSDLEKLVKLLQLIQDLEPQIPESFKQINIDLKNMSSLNTCFSNLTNESEINSFIDYVAFTIEVNSENSNKPPASYTNLRGQIENRLVLQMTNILDESVINFRENNKSDAETLKKIIRAKKKISKELLKKLVDAFPCLIVGIRELGDYIPLEPNIFDIVIIDEASQVSIAQAFPAILRGKKVVILGDSKQYSNVKSHNASTAANNYLFNQVKEGFNSSIVSVPKEKKNELEIKLDSFNIKNSILDFMVNISNYHCTLKKHFRGYMEIIGFSNETFYSNALQVMKIRGIPISDVIQFHKVDVDERPERYKNTNLAEVNYILDELDELKDSGFSGSVGIITPFTNQQKLLSNYIHESPDWKYYKHNFNLKIMTFDSCQGDEKDIIYYPMVEKEDEDILKYIFPVDLSNIAGEGDGTLKAQRLNVGLSRAKESIRFVISKEPEKFKGSIGNAIRYFSSQLTKPDDFDIYSKMDSKSPMEPQLYNYLIQTDFYKKNEDKMEIIPQFDIGRYIKQLDPYAVIPNYRTDFLIIYYDESKAQTVILEYDGFEYHFQDSDYINEFNYEPFYVESDVERRKILESYGYPFIRCNKFIMRNTPIDYLNDQLSRHFNVTSVSDSIYEDVQETYTKIENGEEKVCTRCGQIKPLEAFYDGNLKSKYGRVCSDCKGNKRSTNTGGTIISPTKKKQQSQKSIKDDDIKCPSCGAKMVIREGPYGKFYGCSKYPRCRATKRYK